VLSGCRQSAGIVYDNGVGFEHSTQDAPMRYDAYIFDLDGTIYLGDEPLPGAAETIAALRADGRRTIFLSNNPTKTRQQYAAKLSGMGIVTPVEDIVNSSFVMAQWLRHETPDATLFVVGEDPLIDDLRAAGFGFSERAGEIDVVVASFDRTFVYHKLQVAFDAIREGARLVATNPDRYCPTPIGGEPDAAAIIAAIEACTGARCDPIVGKPSPIMVATIIDMLQLPPDRCIMIGDRLETDIRMGLDAGMATCLVLTGDATREKLAASGLAPTLVLDRIDGLLHI
jgi:phosphoglycolate/pyridoxal phosphate phosphatase family enzyme